MAEFENPGDGGGKSAGAMLAIGELADRIGVPTHVLRYWETRFPQLKPLQRSGRRRYYRAEDVALAERIHHLLHVQGFTVEGARKALSDGKAQPAVEASPARAPAPGNDPVAQGAGRISVEALVALRERLAAALG
ncbi:MerR family transcriptional regulator [Sphingopyxis macrogoltabida]|uniref:MerR family transcriptional regulator n=1 Tax=Sphingopyxis macrogoltabida TaxID=33050 RepID=A0AAC9FFU9_SPHMC|nr:MerR family transcriptional regulator [Sphingopyxis macrogoltabida]ALJ14280.1 MerR family transcriptional regulator [Sphingopyxis macrogoltabida]AMU90545.1 MerR family transcriptional regulator [Sphingopyxis macrogoltabida]